MRESRSYFFTLRELLVIAALAALGGVASSTMSMLGSGLRAVFPFPGGMQVMAGIHVVWLIVAIGVVRKPGVATATGLLKGAVELLSGNPHGLIVVAFSAMEGAVADAAWVLLGRSIRPSTFVVAGGLASASNVFVSAVATSLLGQHALRGPLAALAGMALVSGFVLGGGLGWWLTRMLRHTGLTGGATTDEAASRPPAPALGHVGDDVVVRVVGFGWQFADAATPALRDISLTIRRGEFVVITGPSGSGKSTLALALCGLLVGRQAGRAEGRVVVGGRDVGSSPLHEVAELIGLVQQNPDAHFAALTVDDEIAFGTENRCWPIEEIRRASDEALDLLGIGVLRGRELATLSGGEKQRVAIASMIAARPAILVLDEPTASLDPEASAALFHTLSGMSRRTGLTVVIIEHKLTQLAPLRPRLLRLEGGCVVADEPAGADATSSPAWQAALPTMGQEESARCSSGSGRGPLVELDGVTVRIDGDTILRDISLQVGSGEVVAVLGPNGGGKTTLLHTIRGLVSPACGSIRICGEVVSPGAVSRLARNVGLVFQNADHQLVADTVWDEALFAVRSLKLDTPDAQRGAQRLLAAAGIADRREDHPYRLSWGEKRRLNLISAILHDPTLLLLDEPFAGQDWDNVVLLLDVMRTVVERGDGGGAVVMVTHDLRIVARSCTRVLFVEHGRIVVDAPVPEAFRWLREMGHGAYVPDTATTPVTV